MVEIKMEGEKNSVMVSGEIFEITAQMSYAVGAVHRALLNSGDTGKAHLFRMAMMAAMQPASPTWRTAPTDVSTVVITKKSDTPTDQS